MIYPRVYFQMRKMLKICKKLRDQAQHKEYCDELIAQLEEKCAEIEEQAREDYEALADLDELTKIAQ